MATDRQIHAELDDIPEHVTPPQIHRELDDIPPEHFPIWGKTLGYKRGLPHFRKPPEFSEEGVLQLTAEEVTYQKRCRRVAPVSSRPSQVLTGQVELENGSPPMATPPSRTDYDINYRYPSDPARWPQPTWAPAPPAMINLPEEACSSYDGSGCSIHHYPQHNAFREDPHYNLMMYGNPAGPSMEVDEGQAYPEANLLPSMDVTPGSTSAPTQLDLRGPGNPYSQSQVQGSLDHGEPMLSQLDEVQLPNVGLVSYSYSYDTDRDIRR